MTLTITKTKLAVSIAVSILIGATAAFAGAHPFSDVPAPGAGTPFYSTPVQWAWDNSLTTGSPSGSDTFKPVNAVTRGENITFNYRYDQNVVQPALTTLTAGVAANEADIATNAANLTAHVGRTQTMTIGAADFRPPYDTATYSFPGSSPGGMFSDGLLVAPVHLPDGSTIVSVTMHFYDAGGSSATAWVSREALTTGSFSTLTDIVSSTGTSGNQTVAATLVGGGSEVIAADSYNYVAAATAPSTDERIIGVTITYTAP